MPSVPSGARKAIETMIAHYAIRETRAERVVAEECAWLANARCGADSVWCSLAAHIAAVNGLDNEFHRIHYTN
jgi:hypothetical protein